LATRDLPLGAYPSFRAGTTDGLAESVERVLRARIVKLGEPREPVAAAANRIALSSGELWYCAYGLPILLRFPEGDDLRIQFRRAGAGTTRVGRDLIAVTADRSCIASDQAEVDFGGEFQQVAWRLPKRAVKRKLAALTGQPVTRPIEFDRRLDMTSPQAAALRHILEALLHAIDSGSPHAGKLVIPELENALVTALLGAARHNFRDLLERPAGGAAPWQVSRAESFIEANWDRALTLEDIVSATGCSARSIFRAFRASRGYSPFQFIRQLRLQHARRLLDCGEPSLNVSDVAVACGFENLSRFSKDFSRTFGETPSAVLNRSRSTRSALR
jgi:AraC-like DNA-binding protein